MAIERHFLGWDRPALPLAADYLTHRYATADTLDLSGVILVFPGRRAARRMLELLVERASEDHPDFVPPRMVTFSQLPELLYPQQKKLADDLTQLLLWKRAIDSLPKRAIRPALTSLPPDEALSSWIRLCQSLRRQHDELAAEGLDFDDVVTTLATGGFKEETARWQALRQIQSEYLMQMDDLSLWDRQTSRLIAVDQHECSVEQDIILIGTVDISGIVRRMLEQVADRVTALICAPRAIADHFDEWGCLHAEQWQQRRIQIPDDTTIIAGDPQDQASAVVSSLAALNGSRRADEIVVGTADDSLVPMIIQSLARAGASGRWPVGSSLSTSRPARLLEAIAAHLATARNGELPDFATLSDLVRHIDVSQFIEQELAQEGLLPGKPWLAEFDAYQAAHLQSVPATMLGPRSQAVVMEIVCQAVERLLARLISPAELTPGKPATRSRPGRSSAPEQQFLFGDPQELTSVHARLARRRPLSDWAQGVQRLLNLIYADYQTGQDVQRDESMIATITALNELHESLSTIPAEVMPRCTAAQAIPVLLLQISDLTTPGPADEQAIDLMGWLELPLDDSPVVTVAGFNEGNIPQSVTSDVFLPNSVRSQLGLNDNARRYARDAWALESLLQNRERVRLITGRRDIQGDPLNPSRLWLAGDVDTIASRVRQFFDENEEAASDDTAAVDDQPTIAAREQRQLSRFLVPEPIPVPPAPDHIPVTHFRDYIDCPYRYFLRRELRIDTVADEPREMDARLFGNLIHNVLSRFGDSELIRSTSARRLETALTELLHQEAAINFGMQRSATVAVQLQMAEQRLRAFAEWQAQQTSEGWIIRYSERDLAHPFQDSRDRPVTINGRVDRIDQHQSSGQWRVLDYKTSEAAHEPQKTHRRKGEWVDLQLPLYRLLVRALDIDRRVELGYVNLPGDLKHVGARTADWTDEELASADDKARQVAADILDLRIERITPSRGMMNDELAAICQDTVVDRQIPWLDHWAGRSSETP